MSTDEPTQPIAPQAGPPDEEQPLEAPAAAAELGTPEFPVALRGYDRVAVDAYVDGVRRVLRRLSPPSSRDEAIRHALEEVGEQTGRILQEAHDAASATRARAEEDADRRIADADRAAAEMVQRAERRLLELDTDTEALWRERTRLIEDARVVGRQLLELADRALERFPAEEEGGGGMAAEPAPTEEAPALPEPEPEPEGDLQDGGRPG
jgi:cell division septum initiation protein DivIVA